jgi:hypothetical protein
VEGFRRRHEELLQEYSRIEKWLNSTHASHPDLPYWLVTMDYGQRYSRMARDWSEAASAHFNVWQSIRKSRPLPCVWRDGQTETPTT